MSLLDYNKFSIFYTNDKRFYDIYSLASLESCSDLSIKDHINRSVYFYLALSGKYKVLQRYIKENNIAINDDIIYGYAESGDYEGFKNLMVFVNIDSYTKKMCFNKIAESGNFDAIKDIVENNIKFNIDMKELSFNYCRNRNITYEKMKNFIDHFKIGYFYDHLYNIAMSGNIDILTSESINDDMNNKSIDDKRFVFKMLVINMINSNFEDINNFIEKFVNIHSISEYSLDNIYYELLKSLFVNKSSNIELYKNLFKIVKNQDNIYSKYLEFILKLDIIDFIDPEQIIFDSFSEDTFNSMFINKDNLIKLYNYIKKAHNTNNNKYEKIIGIIKKRLKIKFGVIIDPIILKNTKDDDCSICYEKLNTSANIITNCDHIFHYKCIKDCKSCPLCRSTDFF